MILTKEVNCPFCKKTFYLKSFRLQEAKTVSCLYCKKRIKLETEERLQHRQTNKAQDGVLTSLSKGEELAEGSVPCDSGSKTDSHEVNSVRSEDNPSKSKKHSPFCEGHVDCEKCGSEQCGKVLNIRSDGRVLTVMCLGCMTPRNVKDMAEIEVRY